MSKKRPSKVELDRWNKFLASLEGKGGQAIYDAYMRFLQEEVSTGRVSKAAHDEWMAGVKEIGASGMMQIYHAVVTGQASLDDLMPRKG